MEKVENATPKAPEEATSVGMFLKYTRMAQKKSVETVAKDLCIRKIYIKAIEESDFKELPPVPYGIGFVRSYAEYLGLNSERIAQCYKEEALPKKPEETVMPVVSSHTAAMIPNRRQILISVVAILLIYLIWLAVSCTSQNKEPVQSEAAVEEALAAEIQNSGDTAAVLAEDDILPVNTADSDSDNNQIKIVEDNYYEEPQSQAEEQVKTESRVVVKFNGESWFEIRDAQKVYISGTFPKGFVYNVPDVPGLIFSVGRYYNVDVYIDGQLTQVARPRKQTKIQLDNFLKH